MPRTAPTHAARDRAADADWLKLGRSITDRAREIAAERKTKKAR